MWFCGSLVVLHHSVKVTTAGGNDFTDTGFKYSPTQVPPFSRHSSWGRRARYSSQQRKCLVIDSDCSRGSDLFAMRSGIDQLFWAVDVEMWRVRFRPDTKEWDAKGNREGRGGRRWGCSVGRSLTWQSDRWSPLNDLSRPSGALRVHVCQAYLKCFCIFIH